MIASVIWKNTAAEQDGYVVGLEPATNLPNQRTFETNQGRVVTLAPGEMKTFRVDLHLLVGSDAVKQFSESIRELTVTQIAEILRTPKPGW